MKKLIFTAIFLCLNVHVIFANETKLDFSTLVGLKNPESIVFNSSKKEFYISNVNGAPPDKDGNGFISKISTDGAKNKIEWIKGLHGPKGLGLYQNTLYVADIDALVAIDITLGKIIKKYPLDKAKFPNDISVASDGTVYLSDMMDDSIYVLKNDKLDLLIHDAKLTSPNGLLVEGNILWIASWGKMTDGFKTDVPGTLKKLDLTSLKLSDFTKPMGNLDGLALDKQGHLWISDWMNGNIFQVSGKKFNKVFNFKSGSADLTIVDEQLLIPHMNENRIIVHPIK